MGYKMLEYKIGSDTDFIVKWNMMEVISLYLYLLVRYQHHNYEDPILIGKLRGTCEEEYNWYNWS